MRVAARVNPVCTDHTAAGIQTSFAGFPRSKLQQRDRSWLGAFGNDGEGVGGGERLLGQ